MIEDLLRAVPEVVPAYRGARREWRETVPGGELDPDTVYGSVLVPFVRNLLRTGDSRNDRELLAKVFNFPEQMANGDDEAVKSIVDVSVCEALIDDEGTHDRAREYMGPATRKSLQFILDAQASIH
jgi:hypothetical protein